MFVGAFSVKAMLPLMRVLLCTRVNFQLTFTAYALSGKFFVRICLANSRAYSEDDLLEARSNEPVNIFVRSACVRVLEKRGSVVTASYYLR